MRILHISDTHNKQDLLRNLPDADLLIHSGDFSFVGTESKTLDFLSWLIDLPYRYKIFIAGNHDDYLYQSNIDGLPDNCFYLCNSSVIIEGVKIHGLPMFVEDCITGKYENHIFSTPLGCDILISHQPPFGILDSADGKIMVVSYFLKLSKKSNPNIIFLAISMMHMVLST